MYKVVAGEIVAAKSSSATGYDTYETIQYLAPSGQMAIQRGLVVPSDFSLHIANGNRIALGIMPLGRRRICVAARSGMHLFLPDEAVKKTAAEVVREENSWWVQPLPIFWLLTVGVALVLSLPIVISMLARPGSFLRQAQGVDWNRILP